MSNNRTRIISFISGKGGSGKTTVTISIAKLLSEMGFKCLLVDVDLATNGASYFFKNYFGYQDGILEILENDQKVLTTDDCIKISDSLFFIPSRIRLGTKGIIFNEINHNLDVINKKIVSPIINFSLEKYDYVIFDCQAGFSLSTIACVEQSDLAIIVAEADSISSDAADNLLIQLGSSLPTEKKYLVNKLDVRDAETYRNMKNVFQTLNRLPPLPFDFEVRNAFGARQIPVKITEPSSFLFGLLETAKYIFPELYETISKFKTENIDAIFDKYDKKMNELLASRDQLIKEQFKMNKSFSIFKSKYLHLAVVMSTVIVFSAIHNIDIKYINAFLAVIGEHFILSIVVVIIALSSLLAIKDEYSKGKENYFITSKKLDMIERDLDQYRSFLFARSKDYLFDAEIVKERLHNPKNI